MKQKKTNILKGFIGKLPLQPQKQDQEKISWLNEKILKHQEDQQVKSISLGKFNVFYKRPYELLHTYTEIFTNGIYLFHCATEAPFIIDCGSNIGMSVLNFKTQYPKAKVIAFEPDSNNFELLKKNIETNQLKNVELRQAAVWTQTGKISFEASATEASHISEREESGKQVDSQRLADLLSSVSEVHFMKIDIEGAEWQVIRDCAEELHKVQNLFLEYHGKANETQKLKDIFGILQRAGFSVYVQNAADNLRHPFVNKTTDTIYDVQLNLYCYKF
jgi:FkbM family methyltransferase